MPKPKQNPTPSAMAFLNGAREHHEAAELVFASKPSLSNVLYFHYFHIVELLLKAYLKARGREHRGHKIREYCDEAQQLGLKIERDKSGSGNHLHNVVALLQAGNKDAALRYFTLESRTVPDLAWTRDVVGELLSAVTPVVESTWDKSKSGVPAKLDIIMKVS